MVADEPWLQVDIADEAIRRELAEAIAALELDVVVVGPLAGPGHLPGLALMVDSHRHPEDTVRVNGRPAAISWATRLGGTPYTLGR